MISLTVIILLVSFTAAYVLKGFGFFWGLYLLKKGNNSKEYPVSVVIAARNEEEAIGQCLEALLNQTYPKEKYEIVVVDDQSTDNTSRVVTSYIKEHGNILLLNIHETEKSWAHKKYALTVGIAKSHGEIVMTTDADCVVGSNWIKEMVRYFESEVGMVVGFSQVGLPRKKMTLFEKIQAVDFLSLMSAAAGSIGRNMPLAASGQNLAYRKEAFHNVDGFEKVKNRASGDDILLLQLIIKETDWTVRFAVNEETFVTTQPMKSVQGFINQRRRWASNSPYQMRLNKGFFTYLVATFALNLLLCLTLPLSFVIRSMALVPWICFITKTMVDFAVILKGTHLFQRKDLLPFFPFWEIFHIPFIVMFGVLGMTGGFSWKERTYRKQGFV